MASAERQGYRPAVTKRIDTVLAAFARQRASAILRTPHAAAVDPAIDAAIEGGFRIVELTLNTPGALATIARLAEVEDLVVGAGTVLDLEDARRATDAGARFLVSPVTDPALIGWCRELDLLCIPGAFTPTEMVAAHRAGAAVVKLFPAPDDLAGYVRACRGPLPFLRIFPTAGVDERNAAQVLAAGAFGVGFVGSLFQPGDLEKGDFAAIRSRAARQLGAVRGQS